MATFPIVDLTATDLDMAQLARLADLLGFADTGQTDPNEVISSALSQVAEWRAAAEDFWHQEDYPATPGARLRAAATALARALGRDEHDRQDPTDVMWAAAARLDATPIIPGTLAIDLPPGSLIVRCDPRGAPLELTITRIGEPGYAIRTGPDDQYRVLHRAIEIPPGPGEAIPGERARRLPNGSIVVPATPDDTGDENPEPDAPVAQRHSDGTWHPAKPAGSRYIVLYLGGR